MSDERPQARPIVFLALALAVLAGVGWSIQADLWTPDEERLERLRQERAAAMADAGIQRRRYEATLNGAHRDSARMFEELAEEIDAKILRLMR